VRKWSSENHLVQNARTRILRRIIAADVAEAKKSDIAHFTKNREVFGGLVFCDRRFFDFVLLPVAKFIYAPRRMNANATALERLDALRAYFQEDDVKSEIGDRLSAFFGPSTQTLAGLGVPSDAELTRSLRKRIQAQPLFVGLAVVDQFVRICLAERNSTAKRTVVRDAMMRGSSVAAPAPSKPLPPSQQASAADKKLAKRSRKKTAASSESL
jgi:hypothetical protein